MDNKDTNLKNAKQNFSQIITELDDMSNNGKSLYTVEYHIFKSLIELGKSLLLYYINLLRPMSEGQFKGNNYTVKIDNKGLRKRVIFTIFGLITFYRSKFYIPATKKNIIL